jgi:hypothetical protein
MATEEMIPVGDLCMFHHIDLSFIQSLQKFGLIEISTMEETYYVHSDQLRQLEQFIRWHYELDINLAGIEAITHLLQRIESLQHEIRTLRNRLHAYETDEMPMADSGY